MRHPRWVAAGQWQGGLARLQHNCRLHPQAICFQGYLLLRALQKLFQPTAQKVWAVACLLPKMQTSMQHYGLAYNPVGCSKTTSRPNTAAMMPSWKLRLLSVWAMGLPKILAAAAAAAVEEAMVLGAGAELQQHRPILLLQLR